MEQIVLQVGDISAVQFRVLLWLACGGQISYSVGMRGQSSAALVGKNPITSLPFNESVDMSALVTMQMNGWLNDCGSSYTLTKLGEFIVFGFLSRNKVQIA